MRTLKSTLCYTPRQRSSAGSIDQKEGTMSPSVDTAVTRVLPLPTHFAHAEQSFSLKKRRHPFSSSSTSTSSVSTPDHLSRSLPPLPPSKESLSVSRYFQQKASPWTPLSCSLSQLAPAESVYDPKKQQSYFNQCFTTLGLLGRGSFGEVYKVQNNKDGRLYAVKRSLNRYRGNSDRNRKVREARNHERVCPHPHILNLVAAWEECGRLYIQTELCHTSLLLHAESQTPGNDERATWWYLCDLLSALNHLHSRGFVHMDLKPANVLVTASGRLKLGDFGLLLELNESSLEKVREDDPGGDPRYMAPELLRGEYGPAADVFSLGVSILELACNIEVPNGGDGWQQIRHGHLPEVARGLSTDLQEVLQMMLSPEPSERPTVPELLALPAVRKHRWKRHAYLIFTETMLTLAFFCRVVVDFGRRIFSSLYLPIFSGWSKPAPCTPPKENWDGEVTLPLRALHADSSEDDGMFLVESVGNSPRLSDRMKYTPSFKSTSTPLRYSLDYVDRSPHLDPFEWSPSNEARAPSNVYYSDCNTPSTHTPSHSDRLDSRQTRRSSQRRYCDRSRSDDQPGFGPKNLLCLFEEIAVET
ncbi:membrane-associated tyrosine- and threonine-specific cdc2-inhibitory kinase [Hippocampus zosterae]|uniref:membrane-associated tyrosine- and threonine-specific cdc2-inhibitory kinase n=1 Tax=Hippocampus zosterae TaxID=109293 RepID=UPI00223CCFA4|nr:membrane-associated tyrosine- and threonine-specific cdc2-inhibitory kinase [Hippocampus zosterae]